jgi:hypothetical protein
VLKLYFEAATLHSWIAAARFALMGTLPVSTSLAKTPLEYPDWCEDAANVGAAPRVASAETVIVTQRNLPATPAIRFNRGVASIEFIGFALSIGRRPEGQLATMLCIAQ